MLNTNEITRQVKAAAYATLKEWKIASKDVNFHELQAAVDCAVTSVSCHLIEADRNIDGMLPGMRAAHRNNLIREAGANAVILTTGIMNQL